MGVEPRLKTLSFIGTSRPVPESPKRFSLNQKSEKAADGAAAFMISESVPTKISIDQVLNDSLEQPLSLNDFFEFLKNVEHSEENLEFYLAAKEYNELSTKVSSNLLQPEAPRDLNPDDVNFQPLADLQEKLEFILTEFFTPETEKELNVPAKIRKRLMHDAKDVGDLRPEIFDAALENIMTMLRLSSFPSFCRLNGTSPMTPSAINVLPEEAFETEERPSVGSVATQKAEVTSAPSNKRGSFSAKSFTLKQSLQNQLPAPYTYNNFLEFLEKEHCAENLEFYEAVEKYATLASQIPECWIAPRGDDHPAPEGEPPATLEELENHLTFILDTFFHEDSDKEINVTSKMRHRLMVAVKEQHDLRPSVFDETQKHIWHLLEFSSFPNFRKSVRHLRRPSLTPSASDSVSFKSESNRASVAPSVASSVTVPTSTAPATITPIDTVALAPPRESLSSSTSPKSPKFGALLQQILDKQTVSPHSYEDFYNFLCKEHSQENLDFYAAVQEYKTLAATVPESVLDNPNDVPDTVDPTVIEQLHEQLDSIISIYFDNDSEFELNINGKVRQKVLDAMAKMDGGEVRKSYNPKVFNETLEVIMGMLRLSNLPGFIKLKGPLPVTSPTK